MIKENLVAERVAISSYTEIINWLGDGDVTTRRLFEEILAVEDGTAAGTFDGTEATASVRGDRMLADWAALTRSRHWEALLPRLNEGDLASLPGEGGAWPAPSQADLRRARLLVTSQVLLLAVLALPTHRRDPPAPQSLRIVARVGEVTGLAVVAVAGGSLGSGLTPLPLPTARAQLRTQGMYRRVRHPIYSGLLLSAAARTAASGSRRHAVAFLLLTVLLGVKARWEEERLVDRFPSYPCYAAVTPRFVPWPGRRGRRVLLGPC